MSGIHSFLTLQQTRELISAFKTSQEHSNEDPSHLRHLPPGMQVHKLHQWQGPRSRRGEEGKGWGTGGVGERAIPDATLSPPE